MTKHSPQGDVLDRTKVPVPGRLRPHQLHEMQKVILENGLNVWLVEYHTLPVVAVNLVVQAGSDHDPAGRAGVASMTSETIDEGTATRSALEIADELESIGASLGLGASVDGSFILLNTLTKHLDKGLGVMADILLHPTFPDQEFDRLKTQRLTTLLQQRDQPPTIANNAFSRILYGTGHPYGYSSLGTEESLEQMTRDEVLQFYRAHYRPNNATLIIVGDVRMEQIVERVRGHLAEWPQSEPAAFALPTVEPVAARRCYLIDKPGAPQSEIRIGYPALARTTPDYFAVSIMNRMLGGQFSSRLNHNLRERNGYTYGARSTFSFHKGPGPFSASAGVKTENTGDAVREFFHEMSLMAEEGLTEAELEFVKKGMIGNFALNFETPPQIANALQTIALYNLRDDYFSTYLRNVEMVTLDDVQRSARKYLDVERMAVVIVGDLAVIREQVEKLGLGEVVVWEEGWKQIIPG